MNKFLITSVMCLAISAHAADLQNITEFIGKSSLKAGAVSLAASSLSVGVGCVAGGVVRYASHSGSTENPPTFVLPVAVGCFCIWHGIEIAKKISTFPSTPTSKNDIYTTIKMAAPLIPAYYYLKSL